MNRSDLIQDICYSNEKNLLLKNSYNQEIENGVNNMKNEEWKENENEKGFSDRKSVV